MKIAGCSLALLALMAPPDLTARGSDSTTATVKALAEAYVKAGGKPVSVEGGGSANGARACLDGEAGLAFLSRDLKDEEKTAGLVGVPYGLDSVAVIVHKDNPVSGLTLAELKDLYTGKATTWSDGRPVVLFNRNSDSGTRECFQHVVLQNAPFSEKAAVKHDGVLLSTVARIPTSIAFTSANHPDGTVKVLPIDGVLPTAENTRKGTYPIRRTLILATKGAASGEAKAFIDFALSDAGQDVLRKDGAVPIKAGK